MRNYVDESDKRRRSFFWQGFRLGLIFGIIGALTVLGQRGNSNPPIEPPTIQ